MFTSTKTPQLLRFSLKLPGALIADSKETMACAFLSMALLLGLGANYLFGFWQADPIVGLIIVAFLFREGWEGWREANEVKY